MKHAINLAAAVVLFAFVLCFASCGKNEPDISSDIDPDIKETTVFTASDLHLYSDNLLSPNNQVYIKENLSTDGRIQERDYELVKALVDTVNLEKPDYLILTGDLSFNGERDSHLELTKLLDAITDTKVLVIPGNHDVYSLNCFSAQNDEAIVINGISTEDFRQIYSACGYSGAYSYDSNSLSYIYELSENTWALMLDTTQSKYNKDNGYNLVGGYLETPTMLWLEEHLSYAKENGISVISFTHHNLLVHNELFKSRYTLYNYQEVLELYAKYDVRLNFSGHLHIQSIKSQKTDGYDFYDISGGSLLDYGNRYGRLDIFNNCYSYTSCPLNAPDSTNRLREYAFQVFCQEYYSKTVEQYTDAMGKKQGEKAAQLLSQINAYYFDGSYSKIHDLMPDNKRLIRLIKKNTPNYDGSYVRSIIEVPKSDMHSLLTER